VAKLIANTIVSHLFCNLEVLDYKKSIGSFHLLNSRLRQLRLLSRGPNLVDIFFKIQLKDWKSELNSGITH
jgi:hypothetical protein